MKSRKFEVPQDLICEFAEKVVEAELVNRIVDADEDSLTIEIRYDSQEKEAVYDLLDWYNDHVDSSEA